MGGYGVELLPSNWEFSDEGIKDLDLLITVFEPRDEYFEYQKYINIVNNSFTTDIVDREIILNDDTNVTSVEAFNPETGKFEPVGVMNNSFEISVEKGGSLFLRVNGI